MKIYTPKKLKTAGFARKSYRVLGKGLTFASVALPVFNACVSGTEQGLNRNQIAKNAGKEAVKASISVAAGKYGQIGGAIAGAKLGAKVGLVGGPAGVAIGAAGGAIGGLAAGALTQLALDKVWP